MTRFKDHNPIRPLADGRPRWAAPKGAVQYFATDCYLMPWGGVRWLPIAEGLPFVAAMPMAGRQAQYVVYWRVDADGTVRVRRHCRYPFLAKGHTCGYEGLPLVWVDDALYLGALAYAEIQGALSFVYDEAQGVSLVRTLYPAQHSVGLIERITVRNVGDTERMIRLDPTSVVTDKGERGVVDGFTPADEDGRMLADLEQSLVRTLPVGCAEDYYIVYWSHPADADLMVDCRLEWKKRREQVAECFADTLTVDTPEPLFNRAFAHAYLSGCECVADTVLGAMPYTQGVDVKAVCDAAPIITLSGNYRAMEGWQNVLQTAAEQFNALGTVPAWYDADGHATGHGNVVAFGLAVAQYALLSGRAVMEQYAPIAMRVAEQVMQGLTDGVYRPRGAEFGTVIAAYRLLSLASALADSLGHESRARQWTDAARNMRNRIHRTCVRDFGAYRTYGTHGRRLTADVALPLAAGMDECAMDTAKALAGGLFDGVAHMWRDDRGRCYSDAAILGAVQGLYTVGFSDAATEMARAYTADMLLGQFAPYPVDEWAAGVLADPMMGWRYCRSLLLGWLGLEMRAPDTLGLCLHLPRKWDRFVVRGLHVGGSVLNLTWQDSELRVEDIFGQVLYDDLALCGQHIEMALPIAH